MAPEDDDVENETEEEQPADAQPESNEGDEAKEKPSKSESDSDDEGDNEGEEGKQPQTKGKRLLIIIIAALALLIIGGVVYYLMFYKSEHKAEAPVVLTQEAYYDLDEFVVNLNSGNKPSFLKITITLHVPPQLTPEILKNKLPQIRDIYQIYLRELRAEDLKSTGGLYKIKEELLIRTNKILYPLNVKDVLFKEILIN